MEKFNFWIDPFTQLHPFLVPAPKQPPGILYWIRTIILSPLLFLNLLFFFYNFALLFVVQKFSGLIPRFILRLIHLVLCRILLLQLGFWSLDVRLPKAKKNATSASSGLQVKSGDLIISNHLSYIDLLYFLYQYSPVFAYPPNQWKNDEIPTEGNVQQFSFFDALKEDISQPRRMEKHCTLSLKSVCDHARASNLGPVVYFPEGTTTTGLVLLECAALFKLNDVPLKDVHIVSFAYPETYPIYTVGSFFIHVLKLVSHLSNQMKVQYLSDDDIQAVVPNEEASVEEKLLRLLASNSKIRRGKIMAQKKHEFNSYWYRHLDDYKKK